VVTIDDREFENAVTKINDDYPCAMMLIERVPTLTTCRGRV